MPPHSLPILILHGWGGSAVSYIPIKKILDDRSIPTYIPDFPGFGASLAPTRPWGTDEYAQWVIEQMDHEKIDRCFLYGHSFGGRVAIKLVVQYPHRFQKLILAGVPALPSRRSSKKILFLILAKIGKLFFNIPGVALLAPYAKKMLYRLAREHDYERTDGVMRETFKKVVQENLEPLLAHISIPTQILWGEKDQMTPLPVGKKIQQRIPGASLVVLKNAHHGIHKEQPKEVAEKIIQFFHT